MRTRIGWTQLRKLIGSGDRIGLFTLAFVIVGLVLYGVDASRFAVEVSSDVLRGVLYVALLGGVVAWAWSAALILSKVPKGELITSGPYAVVKHPLYTSVALLVLPAAGLLLGTWLGAVIGIALYAGSRLFAPAEEEELSTTFGARWQAYRRSVLVPWI
jgi:protein-S-isoprenylcysteine O-methyltransferase Ste14